MCREYDTTFYLYTRGPDIVHRGSYEALSCNDLVVCYSMEELLECKAIYNRPFKDVIMDDNTLMLSKD